MALGLLSAHLMQHGSTMTTDVLERKQNHKWVWAGLVVGVAVLIRYQRQICQRFNEIVCATSRHGHQFAFDASDRNNLKLRCLECQKVTNGWEIGGKKGPTR